MSKINLNEINEYYSKEISNQLGCNENTWNDLRESFLESEKKVALLNPFIKMNWEELFEADFQTIQLSSAVTYVQGKPKFSAKEAKEKWQLIFLPYYWLDEASILAAFHLKVKEAEVVADFCAAPGGKTLVLAFELFFGAKHFGTLVANEFSENRRFRLKQNLQDFLPPEVLNFVKVKGFDATQWGRFQKNMYDAILLDAPCSSERHLFTDPQMASFWSKSRSKNLSYKQNAMLCAAIDALKLGGRLNYSTCAILDVENDLAIEKLFTKRSQAKSEEITFKHGRATRYGWRFWPNEWKGAGPLYLASIRKN